MSLWHNYVELFSELTAGSNGAGSDQGPVSGSKDTKRLPVRVEVHDLIHRIERKVRACDRYLDIATGSPRCLYPPRMRKPGSPDPHVWFALGSIAGRLGLVSDETRRLVERNLDRVAVQAQRMTGKVDAPRSVSRTCPVCGRASVFRVESARAVLFVCCNSLCEVDGKRRRWTEDEWENATSGVH